MLISQLELCALVLIPLLSPPPSSLRRYPNQTGSVSVGGHLRGCYLPPPTSSSLLPPAPTCSSLQSAAICGARPTANPHTRRRMPRSAGTPTGSRQQSLSCHFTASVQHCQIRLSIRSAPLMKSVTVTIGRLDPTPAVANLKYLFNHLIKAANGNLLAHSTLDTPTPPKKS